MTFNGKTYPFKVLGTVLGPGSVSKVSVTGDVYRLDDPSQFTGVWVEGTGAVGLETAQTSDLWLQNKAGVVMHLTGTQTGVTLSLGKDEIFIKLGAPSWESGRATAAWAKRLKSCLYFLPSWLSKPPASISIGGRSVVSAR